MGLLHEEGGGLDAGVGADEDGAVDGFLDAGADAGEAVAAHEEGWVWGDGRWGGGAGGDVVFYHGRGGFGDGGGVEAGGEGWK